nr:MULTISPECIES: diacylglycerol kinase [Vibrio]
MLIVKPGKTGLSRLIDATGYSIKGLKAAWLYEAAFRQELLACVVLIMSTFFMSVSNIERILLISSLLLVLTVELINSAIEAVVDRIGDEWHELSGRAKDIGSAAVFISLLLAGFVWLSILVK